MLSSSYLLCYKNNVRGSSLFATGDMQEVLVHNNDCALAPTGGLVCAIWTQESSAVVFYCIAFQEDIKYLLC